MSSTDTAFIRAYATRRATSVDRASPLTGPGTLGISMSETVMPSPHASFSELVIPSHHLPSAAANRPVGTGHGVATHVAATNFVTSNEGASVAVQEARPANAPIRATPSIAPNSSRIKTFSLGPVGPDQVQIRIDSASSHERPHIKMGGAPTGNSNSIQNGLDPATANLESLRQNSSPQAPGSQNNAPETPNSYHRYDSGGEADPHAPHALVHFHSNWEVDAFQWPDLCNRLQGESASGLSGLLRSVLHRAWRGKNVFAATSFSHGEGTTTVTLCLAKLAAMFDVKVAIIDGNIGAPHLIDDLGVSAEHGWSDLGSDIPLSEIAVRSLDDHVVVVPLRELASTRDASALQNQAATVVSQLADSFELVLIDTGPMFHAAHLWLSEQVRSGIHGGIVIRNMRLTSPEQMDDVCVRLQQAHIREVLVVENFQQPARENAHV